MPTGQYGLLADGSLVLEVDARLAEAVRRWLPLGAVSPPPGGRLAEPTSQTLASARIAATVEEGLPLADRVPGEPSLRLGGVSGWISAGGASARLSGEAGCRCRIGLQHLTAEIQVPAAADPAGASRDVYSMLTLASALLLGRLGRTLVHAAAVVAPDGAVWLLIGDAGAGKSTTTSTLARAGWNYLSDDQVVLGPLGDDGIAAEGWLRPFHLDTGWWSGVPAGERVEVDPDRIGPGRRRRRAPLGRLLFCSVEPSVATAAAAVPPAEALSLLIRQSPWVLADPGAAPAVLDLLRAVVRLPAFRLRLGLDSYNDPSRLQYVLQARRVREGG